MSETTDSTSHHHGTDVEPAQPHAGNLGPGFADPGLPAHVYRQTDIDPRAARRAERQVASLFLLSALAAVGFVVAFFAVPLTSFQAVGTSRLLTGLTLAVALFCIGAGAIHWAKKLMPDDEVVEERHPIRSTDEERAGAAAVFREGGQAAGFPRRKVIWGSLGLSLGAVAVAPLVTLWDLWYKGRGKSPAEIISHTAWKEGTRLVSDPIGAPIKAADVPIGTVVHVLPEVKNQHGGEAPEGEHAELSLNEIAKAAVLLIRLRPDELQEQDDRRDWSYNGIVAYSKICTHVGCPVGLYEQTTHHLLCPCHQSTFDVLRHCEVIFGPAARPLPQLAITVDPEGYLVARHDFTEPVGPSFWERG